VGVDEQPADAVGELARDRPVLLRGEPPGERDGHRVVCRDEGDPVERLVAERGVAVAPVGPRRRGRRAARAEEDRDDGDDQPRRRERDDEPTAAAPGGAFGRRRRLRRRRRRRAVDEAEQRVRADVDQQDAQQRDRERDHRVASEERDHSGRDQGDRAQRTPRRR
jgi:hypothetical protein